MDSIRTLLELIDLPTKPSEEIEAVARHYIADIDSRVSHLAKLRAEIEATVDENPEGTIRECRLLRVLADHDVPSGETC